MKTRKKTGGLCHVTCDSSLRACHSSLLVVAVVVLDILDNNCDSVHAVHDDNDGFGEQITYPPRLNADMAWTLPAALWLLVLSSVATSHPATEHLKEELNLQPLRDGRVAAHFSFQTTLRNSLPRSPDTLPVEDKRTF